MSSEKREHPKVKSRLHPKNKHRERYNLKALVKSTPELADFVVLNKYKDETIDFANPEAVKMLNKALLKHHYGIEGWDIPKGYLCPPIPGRADYIHHIADFLSSRNFGRIPTGKKITILDIGVGANCVYPLVGTREYDWSFIGGDIDKVALDNAETIISKNEQLKNQIEFRFQESKNDIFYGMIQPEDKIDLSICNPPFHESVEAAKAGTLRKLNNLNKKKTKNAVLNFGGKYNELCCEGGERRFLNEMVRQSKRFAESCLWFSTLVSKQSNLKNTYKVLEKHGVVEMKTIPMGQGNKTSRIVAWTFQHEEAQSDWITTRWKN